MLDSRTRVSPGAGGGRTAVLDSRTRVIPGAGEEDSSAR